jgi:hypothetical protein
MQWWVKKRGLFFHSLDLYASPWLSFSPPPPPNLQLTERRNSIFFHEMAVLSIHLISVVQFLNYYIVSVLCFLRNSVISTLILIMLCPFLLLFLMFFIHFSLSWHDTSTKAHVLHRAHIIHCHFPQSSNRWPQVSPSSLTFLSDPFCSSDRYKKYCIFRHYTSGTFVSHLSNTGSTRSSRKNL